MKITASPGKRRILIVEDDDDIQLLLRTLLKRHDFEVECADSGMTAFSILTRFKPHLILLDMAMPDMDGLTFLRRRSRFPEFSDIPVIVVSARDRNTDVMAAIELGADNYITKPFDAMKLLASIDRLAPAQRPADVPATQVLWK